MINKLTTKPKLKIGNKVIASVSLDGNWTKPRTNIECEIVDIVEGIDGDTLHIDGPECHRHPLYHERKYIELDPEMVIKKIN